MMNEKKKLCDYFVVAGLGSQRTVLQDALPDTESSSSSVNHSPHRRTSLSSSFHHRDKDTSAPITDICVINTSLEEEVPHGYFCIEKTQYDFPANLNHGSIKSPSMFLCYRRGHDKPPLVDIGVLYDSKEIVRSDSHVIDKTYYGTCGNVNNSTSKIFLTYRKADSLPFFNQLVVTDICVILASKGETPPHAFCKIDKNLNKGLLGSNVYICYKKSLNCPPLIRYTPSIIDRYPKEDVDCYPLPNETALFCLPMGCTVECWSKDCRNPGPSFSTFVLTSYTAVKVYGAAVNYYEDLDDEEAKTFTEQELQQLDYKNNVQRLQKSLHVKKSICILSRWPCFETFHKFVLFLYNTYVGSRSRAQTIPIEVYISYFMHNVPFPSIQRPHILVQLGAKEEETVELSYSSEEMPLPLSGASFSSFLRALGPENCMIVFLCSLTEQKILLHSLNLNFLTSVAEAVTSLMFPFHWQFPYVPLCPLVLCKILSAPMPFIAGVDSSYFDVHEPPSDLVCISLDTHNIFMSETKRHLNLKLMPKRATKVLRNRLDRLFDLMLSEDERAEVAASTLKRKGSDATSERNRLRRLFDLEIQEAFLQFVATILKDFRTYLKPITKAPTVGATDPSSLFDFNNFLRTRERSSQPFYNILIKTQMFTRFIEERSFVSDKDTSLAFFDECLNKVENDPDFENSFKVIDFDDGKIKSDRTVFIPPPDEPCSPSTRLSFKYFVKKIGPFNHSLFAKGFVAMVDDRTKKNDFFSSNNQLSEQQTASFIAQGGQPMSKRTKQEIRLAQKVAHRLAESPLAWTKCLVSYCYSLWFVHLPSFIKGTEHVYPIRRQLEMAFDVLLRMQSLKLHPLDEVCYRILMLLCGVYSNPILAVRILHQMKLNDVRPNAITYGYYNRAVLESRWPSDRNAASLMWTKLRNAIQGIAEFKRLGKVHRRRNWKADSSNDLATASASGSNSSFSVKGEVKLLTNDEPLRDILFENKLCSIVRNGNLEQPPTPEFSEEAGLLMLGQVYLESVRSGRLAGGQRRSGGGGGKLDEMAAKSNRNEVVSDKVVSKVGNWRSVSLGQKAIQKFKEENLWPLRRELDFFGSRLDEDEEAIVDQQQSELGQEVEEVLVAPVASDSVDFASNNDGQFESNENLEQQQQPSQPTSLTQPPTFTPIKDTFLNMNFFSPEGKVASTLRNSFRMARTQLATNSLFKGNIPKSFTFQSEAEISSSPLARKKTNETGVANLQRCQTEDQPDSFSSIDYRKTNLTRSSTLPPSSKPNHGLNGLGGSGGGDRKTSAQESFFKDKSKDQSLDKLSERSLMTTGDNQLEGGKSLSNELNSIWNNKQKHINLLNSTFKSATNSMANRINEIKTSLASNNSSPSRLGQNNISQVMENTTALLSNFANLVAERLPANLNLNNDESLENSSMNYQFSEVDGAGGTAGVGGVGGVGGGVALKRSRENSLVNQPMMEEHNFYDLLETLHSKSLENWSTTHPKLVYVQMTSCSKCHKCQAIVYDEEIMSSWSPDDSNLNTICSFCDEPFVPLLTVEIKFDEQSMTSSLECKKSFRNKFDHHLKRESPFTVAYLSPIVLRKELENILENEGDFCLSNVQFVAEHPIVYWNLVWYFQRTNLPSHLPGLYLNHLYQQLQVNNVNKYDYRNVYIQCFWDNEKIHEDRRKPLFYLWRQTSAEARNHQQQSKLIHALLTESLTANSQQQLRQLLQLVEKNDMSAALKHFLHSRLQPGSPLKPNYSIYRDLLFLSFAAIGRKNIDSLTFDREYRHAYDLLNSEEAEQMRKADRPPSLRAILCRRSFKDLELKSIDFLA